MSDLETIRAYRRLFMEGDKLTPDAEKVLRDLEKECGWMRFQLPTDDRGAVDPYRAAASVEKRATFAHIKNRLFGDITKLIEKEARQ